MRASRLRSQREYSLWSREPQDEILPTVRELGIGDAEPIAPRYARTGTVADVVAAIKETSPVETLRVDGGMVGNELLMQFQSDLLGVPVKLHGVLPRTSRSNLAVTLGRRRPAPMRWSAPACSSTASDTTSVRWSCCRARTCPSPT